MDTMRIIDPLVPMHLSTRPEVPKCDTHPAFGDGRIGSNQVLVSLTRMCDATIPRKVASSAG